MTEHPLRLFVPPGSCSDAELTLEGRDAERVYLRGARAGDTFIALDDSGWELTVLCGDVTSSSCRGQVVGRALAEERRTKVSLYHGLLHPSDFRRLLTGATGRGVVAIVPLITDGSVVPMMSPEGRAEGEAEWPRLVRDAAESSGRGRRPALGPSMLFNLALDEAVRSGTRLLLIDPTGGGVTSATEGRPFSVDVFCGPPAGFTDEELDRAAARGVAIVAPPEPPGGDPIQPALSIIDALYDRLEEPTTS